MIKYFTGTVFNSDAQAIVNTVNCDGVMGAGIALEFALRYPQMLDDYVVKCDRGDITIGSVDYYYDKSGKTIVNFPTKHHFRFPSRIEWVEAGLQNFSNTYMEHNITSIAFPKLGTNKGGLPWSEVKVLMEKYLDDLPIDVYICLDENPEAEGVERIMIDKFNDASIEKLCSVVRLNDKQKLAIDSKKPFRRFWHIGSTESIGSKTYEKIFKYYYDLAKNGVYEYEQLSLLKLAEDKVIDCE